MKKVMCLAVLLALAGCAPAGADGDVWYRKSYDHQTGVMCYAMAGGSLSPV